MKQFIGMLVMAAGMLVMATGCATTVPFQSRDQEPPPKVLSGPEPKADTLVNVHHVTKVRPEVGPVEYYILWSNLREQEIHLLRMSGSPFGSGFGYEADWRGEGMYHVGTVYKPFRFGKVEWTKDTSVGTIKK